MSKQPQPDTAARRTNSPVVAGRRGAIGLAAVLAGLLGCEAAHAQEVPRASEGGTPTGYADWSGPYLGIGGAFGSAGGRYRFGNVPVPGADPAAIRSGYGASGNDSPWSAGGFAGYNWQVGRVVFGLEAGVAAASTKRAVGGDRVPAAGLDPDATALVLKRDVLGSARARIGYSVDDVLLYATAGIAGANARARSFLVPGGWTDVSERFGATYGLGVEAAVSEHWTLGVDYQRSRFDAAGAPRVGITSDDVMARLTYHPNGIRLAPEAEDGKGGERQEWSLHGQTTFIGQATPRFRSPYTGEFSFLPRQARETWSLTGYVGRRLWDGAELYFNPELNQGFGLSRTLGIAGYINGEAQKAGASYPKFRPQRYFLRQVFGLGGETETVEDGPNQIAGARDVDRVTITAGRFAVGDFFDDNAYAHDPRLNFQTWSLWSSAAFDFPANLPGFTHGAVVELNRKEWAIRAGAFQVPKEPNSDVLDPRIDRKGGAVIEFEGRYDLGAQSGKLRLGAFTNQGRMASYRLATNAAILTGIDINDAATLDRKDRSKSGVYANLEHTVTSDFGVFARASWNDGQNRILSFTDIDRSVSGGFQLKGTSWDRAKDSIGVGVSLNGLSRPHRDYLAAGGLGLLIGDGRLNYANERSLEAYYRMALTDELNLTANYQFVANPGYNADRGPVNVVGLRLRTEF